MKTKAQELTNQFSYTWANLLQDIGEIYNIPDLDSQTCSEMLKDESIFSGLKFFASNVANSIGQFIHDKEEIQDFVQENFEELSTSFAITLAEMVIKMKTFGFCVAEIVWKVKQNHLMLSKLVILDPLHTTFNMENGEIKSVNQYTAIKGRIEIPANKCFILRNGSGLYGESALIPVYRSWKMKKVLMKFWAIAMERYAVPVLVGKTQGDTDKLSQALAGLWTNGIIASTPDTDINVLEPKNTVTETFTKAIDHLDMMIYRGLLLPRLLGGPQASIGSYALGKVQLDLFLSAVRQEANRIAEEVIDQIVAKIIEYNFIDVDSYGSFTPVSEMTPEDKAKFTDILSDLSDMGILDPVSDENWIRNMLGLPITEQPVIEPEATSEEQEK